MADTSILASPGPPGPPAGGEPHVSPVGARGGAPEGGPPRAARTQRLAYAAALLAIVGWGSLFPASKPALREVTPVMIVFVRATLACVLLSALSIVQSGGVTRGLAHLRRQAADAGWWVVAVGLLSFTITALLAVGAQQFLPASINSVLNNLMPLWLALYASLSGRARSATLLLGGSALAALGVAVVLLGGNPGALGADSGSLLHGRALFGAGLSLLGSVIIAGSQLVARRVMPGRDPLAITAVAAGVGALPTLALLALGIGGSFPQYAATSLQTKALLLWLGTMSTAFNFSLWYFALAHLPVTRIAHFQYLVVPLGVALSIVLLKEPAGPGLLAGTLAILAGIALAQRGAEPAG